MRTIVTLSLLTCGVSALAADTKREQALASLVSAERAFARASVERGLRDAFLAFFAEDGIGFQPLPVRVKANLLKQPAPTGPATTLVSWAPELADVALSGELGYTTGPATIEDRSPARQAPRHGTYFTIWRRQQDGAWRAVLDAGTDGPEGAAPRAAVLATAPASSWRCGHEGAAARASILEAERALLEAFEAQGAEAAMPAAAAPDARLHRWGFAPIVGAEAIRSHLAGEKRSGTWKALEADASGCGDLGYAYGRYELQAADATSGEKGFYARVWKRDGSGRFRVVLDTWSPVPQGRSENAYVSAGYAYLERGETQEAIWVFERLAAEHPKSANAYDCLSDAHLAAGDRARAQELARRALSMLADDPNPDAAFKERVRQSAASKLAPEKRP